MPTALAKRRPRPAAAAAADPSAGSLRLAAIDVGSNSVHMIVAQVDADGGVTTLWRVKEMVGLGRISFPGKRLSAEAIARAVTTLERMKQVATQRGAERIVVVATSAVREAVNGGELIARVLRQLDLYIRVVSASEEARLIYLGVRHALDLGRGRNLIIDIGGGSVEFIVGNARDASILQSRKLGAARLTASFVKSDPIAKPDRKAIEAHLHEELDPLLADIAKARPTRVIGTSGTFENLARLCGELDDLGRPVIRRKRFREVLKRLVDSDSAQREAMADLDAHRKEQIVAAAMLVGFLFEHLPIASIEICGAALREGILVDYLARHAPDVQVRRDVPDPRRRAVLDLARRCHWNQAHATHVTALALRLFDQLRAHHKLGRDARELVEYAALLHDIGWHIAPGGHHKHAMYLIQNSDLRDHFAMRELDVMANIARYHRKRPPSIEHPWYAALTKADRRIVDVGAALLRVADGLDRSHSSAISDVRARLDRDGGITCRLVVRSDAELEMWDAKRKSDWFEQVFKRPIDFEMPAR